MSSSEVSGQSHIDFVHEPHPHTEKRKLKAPPLVADEHVGFNGRIAAAITRSVGTMWAVYVAFAIQVTYMILATVGIWLFARDPYPFALLLLMFVIMVGQQVLGQASDKRAVVTYQDAEAILHECIQMQKHLTAQDKALYSLIKRMEQLEARIEKTAG